MAISWTLVPDDRQVEESTLSNILASVTTDQNYLSWVLLDPDMQARHSEAHTPIVGGVDTFDYDFIFDKSGQWQISVSDEFGTDSINTYFNVIVGEGPYADVDLGIGFKVPLIHCHMSEETMNSTKGIFNFKAPGLYDVKFPYVAVKEAQESFSPKVVEKKCNPTVVITPFVNNIYDDALAWSAQCRIVYGNTPYKDRPNQRTYQTWQGEIETYDSNLTNIKGTLSIHGLSRDDGKALDVFIDEVLQYNNRKFKLEVYE